MNPQTFLVVTTSRHFDAPPESVFDRWLDPAKVGEWLFATPTGHMKRIEMDARVFGRYTIVERCDDEDAVHTGHFLEIERPRRLVFTCSADGSPSDPVSVEIEPSANGCELTLSQALNPRDADFAEQTRREWSDMLDGLARTLN